MKRKIALASLVLLLFIATGCWSRVELDKRAIVAGFGVDKAEEEGKMKVTVQVVKPGEIKAAPSAMGGSPKAVAVYTGTGYTFFDTIRNLAMAIGKKLFLTETEIVVVGEELAREGIGKVTDFYGRDPEPCKEKEEGKEEGEGKAGEDKAVLPKEVKVSGTAVFRHYKLTGWLDEKETRGLLWATGKIKSGIIVVPAPESGDKLVALEILRAKGEVKPEITDGNLTITVEVKEEGNLGEEQPDSVDITKPGVLEELEERKKAAIEDEIMAAVFKAQELNADVFGFGEAVRRKYPKQWKQLEDKWDEIFPTLEVNMLVDAKIRRTGKITKPAEPKS